MAPAEPPEPQIGWGQYRLNHGSYCMHIMDGQYCGRGKKWAGHISKGLGRWPQHVFVPGAPVPNEIAMLRAEIMRLKDALKTVGDDYPGSSCQWWCYQQAGLDPPFELANILLKPLSSTVER